LFVTNSLNHLSQCDQIIMLEKGIINASGKYDELKFKIGKMSNFFENNDNKITDEGILFIRFLFNRSILV
jgi:hypothetical protein